jgi:hypothetical protein
MVSMLYLLPYVIYETYNIIFNIWDFYKND